MASVRWHQRLRPLRRGPDAKATIRRAEEIREREALAYRPAELTMFGYIRLAPEEHGCGAVDPAAGRSTFRPLLAVGLLRRACLELVAIYPAVTRKVEVFRDPHMDERIATRRQSRLIGAWRELRRPCAQDDKPAREASG